MFFSKKPKQAEISFNVYFTKLVKYQQLVVLLKEASGSSKILYYFDETRNELSNLIDAAKIHNCEIFDARNYSSNAPDTLILSETHPLASVANKLLSRVHPETNLQCFIGMDEVLMKLFGSDRIIGMMQKMGMKQDEAISHPMVTGSLQKAQLKLDQKITHPIDERESAEKWAIANKMNQIGL